MPGLSAPAPAGIMNRSLAVRSDERRRRRKRLFLCAPGEGDCAPRLLAGRHRARDPGRSTAGRGPRRAPRAPAPAAAAWEAAGAVAPPPGPQKTTVPLKKEVVVTGADLGHARAGFEGGQVNTGQPIVTFQFRGPGAK